MDSDFQQLIQEIGRGDADALAVILREYGPYLRRFVRQRLLTEHVRRAVGDSDIYQSVVLKIWSRLRQPDCPIEAPGQLMNLMKGIANSHVIDVARRYSAWMRGGRDTFEQAGEELPERHQHTPSEMISLREELGLANNRLSPENRNLLDRRIGHQETWEQIAADSGRTAESLRKQLERALAELRSEDE